MINNQTTSEETTSKKVNQNNLIFILNYETKTADIIGNEYNQNGILFLRSIYYEKQEFIIKSIKENVFRNSKIKSVRFQTDFELTTIEKNAFRCCSIESLFIPQSVSELKKGWCYFTPNLKKVTIIEKNPYFKNCEEDDRLIFGKSDIKNNEYDILIFVSRDINTVTIPSSIKEIYSDAFSYSSIEKVYFSSKT